LTSLLAKPATIQELPATATLEGVVAKCNEIVGILGDLDLVNVTGAES